MFDLCLLATGGQDGGNTRIAFVVFVMISFIEQIRPVIGPPMIITKSSVVVPPAKAMASFTEIPIGTCNVTGFLTRPAY